MEIKLTPLKKCPVCSGKNRKVLFELEQFSVIRCSCGHRFIDPCLHEDTMIEVYETPENLAAFDSAHDHYYEYETLKSGCRTFKDYQHALKQISSLGGKGKILEVGCGTGSFVRHAIQEGWEAVGLDSSSDNVKSLEENGVKGVCSPFLNYETDERYDCVVFWDLIEHISDPLVFLNKSKDLLKPGGLVVVAGPLYPNLLTQIAEPLFNLTRGKIRAPVERMYFLEHTSYFSKKTLAQLLERATFHVLESWKTETDLNRYTFPGLTGKMLPFAFLIARVLNLQNRIIMIAKKEA